MNEYQLRKSEESEYLWFIPILILAMTERFLMLLTLLWATSCKPNDSGKVNDYPDQFGEIAFDASQDHPDFKLCNPKELVHSRVSLGYEGGRKRIEVICKEVINESEMSFPYNGYVLVRFLVNCDGASGRFRIETMDYGFNEQECPKELVSLIENAVRSLDEWVVEKPENVGKDHSKYLNFKIINGRVDAIIH